LWGINNNYNMNYKIILNEDKLRKFIEWLPDLEVNEKYYLCLFSRKKYSHEIKSNDKTQIKRFVSNKDRIFDKIKQLECEVGSYKLRNSNVPQDSLVLYINPNPRNMLKATFQLAKKAITLIEGQSQNYNIHAEALSCIQRSKSKSRFCDFDVDDENAELNVLKKIFPKKCYDILKTRGGYHILVNTKLAPKIKWHEEIRKKFNVDNIGDQLIPVVGCTQGGFEPKFIKI